MASVYMPQAASYQQQQQHFEIMNGSIVQLPQPQMQSQQQQQHHSTPYGVSGMRHQSIAPAPTKTVLGNSNLHNIQLSAAAEAAGSLLARKKYTYANMPYGQQLPSVARRNARERNRVKQVNNGFANLRQHLPQSVINTLSHGGRGASKKLSKVDTLRIAVEYIRGLKDLVEDGDSTGSSSTRSDEGSNDGYYSAFASMQHFYNSEASGSSTPSYSDSDSISVGESGGNYAAAIKLEPQFRQQQQQQLKVEQEEQFKFDDFESYSPLSSDDQPDDDEELLDYITSWQEQ